MLNQLFYEAAYRKLSKASKVDNTEGISNDNVYLAPTSRLLKNPK